MHRRGMLGTVQTVTSYFRRRVLFLAAVGFASGLPYLLTSGTLSTWMRREGVDMTTIGLFGLIALPYNFKFLWAPLLDRFGLGALGRRRGWMLLFQVLLFFSICAMGNLSPSGTPFALAVLALVTAFFSASLDVVTDAYRTDILSPEERGPGAATYVVGYRMAMLVAGGVALVLADHMSFSSVYIIMGGLMLVSGIATVLAPTADGRSKPPQSLADAIVKPLSEFARRPGFARILAFVALYKVGEVALMHLAQPFLIDVGFSTTTIGAVNKGVGMVATIVGTIIGGGLVARLGILRSLLLFGVLQALTNIAYLAVAVVGKNYELLVAAVAVDQFFGGLATAAFVVYLMTLCNRNFSATQYAIFTSASSLLGRLLTAGSGAFVEASSWSAFFIMTAALAIPGLLLIHYLPQPTDAPQTP